ncbi:DUF4145 domain-containing protein [Allopontixanthobacter sp.]|uniref:DUF4145 domain-containing protein n=1 Tax=Allopontixanthobacter sp. TaxID=2906452 RepID=UPI002AB802FA|nr:DUF4145 domain-containing protein [Allopontixanthobacter sp.]MDZ4307249.1 DUF4145 domain-containing protein [Allopontixanthobacter sp.]
MAQAELSAGIVYGVDRCPQCGVATPLLEKVDKCHLHYVDSYTYGNEYWYFTASCSRCKNHVLFYGAKERDSGREEPKELSIIRSFPNLEKAAEELPQKAAKFLQQALESKHAPDGALMLAASAIDAMLKDKGFKAGTLYQRIQKAHKDGLLTMDMEAWAHEMRLSANEPRHADDEFDGATTEDAEQILAFAKALGQYLYVLPAQVKRWQTKAVEPGNPGESVPVAQTLP